MTLKQFFGCLIFLSYFGLFCFASAYVSTELEIFPLWTLLFVVVLGYFKYEMIHWGTDGEYLP